MFHNKGDVWVLHFRRNSTLARVLRNCVCDTIVWRCRVGVWMTLKRQNAYEKNYEKTVLTMIIITIIKNLLRAVGTKVQNVGSPPLTCEKALRVNACTTHETRDLFFLWTSFERFRKRIKSVADECNSFIPQTSGTRAWVFTIYCARLYSERAVCAVHTSFLGGRQRQQRREIVFSPEHRIHIRVNFTIRGVDKRNNDDNNAV